MAEVNWSPAAFYRPEGPAVRCTLCPHACLLDEGQAGRCHVRRRNGLGLETRTMATAVEHWDPVERKPLYHYRPGSTALTLAAPGCTFSCRYCQNYRLSQFGRDPAADGEAKPVQPAELVAKAAAAGAAIALSYSEPTLAAELTLALAAAARPAGVALLWKTNGFLAADALRQIAPHLAAVNIDLKAADEAAHQRLTGAPLAPVLRALDGFLEAGVWVEVTTPVIPTVNDEGALSRIAELLARRARHIPWHLARFAPEYRLSHLPPTSPAQLARAVHIARAAGLEYVYVERALGPGLRSTACPRCGCELIRRGLWCTESLRLRDGACPACRHPIPGRWE